MKKRNNFVQQNKREIGNYEVNQLSQVRVKGLPKIFICGDGHASGFIVVDHF